METIDGSAEAGQDYVKIQEVLEFGPNETEKVIEVCITYSREGKCSMVLAVNGP